MEAMQIVRLQNARIWVAIVFSYYLMKAGFSIFPRWKLDVSFQNISVVIQIAIAIYIICGVCWSFKYNIGQIRWLLYI